MDKLLTVFLLFLHSLIGPALAFHTQTSLRRAPPKKGRARASNHDVLIRDANNNPSGDDANNNKKFRNGLQDSWNNIASSESKFRLNTAATAATIFASVIGTPLSIHFSKTQQPPFVSGIIMERPTAQAIDPLTKNQRFVSDVWFAVTAQFFDPSYGGLGEDGWRNERDLAIAAVAGLDNGPKDRPRVDAVIDTMLSSLQDPYTRYLPPDQYEAITSYTRGNNAGIGVQLLLDSSKSSSSSDDAHVMVVNIVKDGPAELGGMRVGDVIIEVDGKNMKDATPEFVAAQCRGEPGAKVQVAVQRRGEGVKRFSLTRSNVKVPSVDSSMFVSDYSGAKYGLLKVSSFTQNTPAELADGIQELVPNKDNSGGKSDTTINDLEAVVIDLRGNVGGYMPAGIDSARKFLPARAAIVAEIDRAGSGTYFFGDAKSVTNTFTPLYILVDERTASAAEIFTAALKDNRRAFVVGPTRTFGKGRIQNIQSLEDGSGIAVTRARYITPTGRDIHGVGIRPNRLSETCGPEASAASCLNGMI